MVMAASLSTALRSKPVWRHTCKEHMLEGSSIVWLASLPNRLYFSHHNHVIVKCWTDIAEVI